MESQQKNQNYDPSSRYNSWKANFCESIQELCKQTTEDITLEKFDEVSVEFKNVEDKLSSLQEKVDEYNSKHKKKVFYFIQDSKNELQLKLDKIELNNQEDLRAKRTQLFKGLEIVSNQLNSKIHEEGTSICPHCHQRTIVVPQLTRKEY